MQVCVTGLSYHESYFINFRCLVNTQCYTMLLKLVQSIFEVFWKKSYFQWGELVSSYPTYKILFLCSGQVLWLISHVTSVHTNLFHCGWGMTSTFLRCNIRRTWVIIVFFFLELTMYIWWLLDGRMKNLEPNFGFPFMMCYNYNHNSLTLKHWN